MGAVVAGRQWLRCGLRVLQMECECDVIGRREEEPGSSEPGCLRRHLEPTPGLVQLALQWGQRTPSSSKPQQTSGAGCQLTGLAAHASAHEPRNGECRRRSPLRGLASALLRCLHPKAHSSPTKKFRSRQSSSLSSSLSPSVLSATIAPLEIPLSYHLSLPLDTGPRRPGPRHNGVGCR